MSYNMLLLKDRLEDKDLPGIYDGYLLHDRVKSILTSNGSLTRLLEDLYSSQINIELKEQSVSHVEQEMADFLEIEKGEEVINRDAWLKINKERLVFAYSVIPIKELDKPLIDMLSRGEKPLGILLEDSEISVQRDSLRICVIRCGEIAEDICLPLDHSFLARRYRIRSGDRALAGITEVFSPKVFENG